LAEPYVGSPFWDGDEVLGEAGSVPGACAGIVPGADKSAARRGDSVCGRHGAATGLQGAHDAVETKAHDVAEGAELSGSQGGFDVLAPVPGGVAVEVAGPVFVAFAAAEPLLGTTVDCCQDLVVYVAVPGQDILG